MPIQPPWAERANDSDAAVVSYRGVRERHLVSLRAQGVDTAPYEAAQLANKQLDPNNTSATRERVLKAFVDEKRKILKALAAGVAAKVGRDLQRAVAHSVEAVVDNVEIDTRLRAALESLQSCAAHHAAGAAHHAAGAARAQEGIVAICAAGIAANAQLGALNQQCTVLTQELPQQNCRRL